ncbi:MAG: tetratricopeptide repeat protein [Vicinamibacterales bacterium]
MAAESARILDLRRRVQADPSSIAFAQLAEELRRAGENAEAIDVCRSGLARHPGYLSARVTLGRALLELDQLEEARDELSIVVRTAPDNLAAIRGLAEIHQRRGQVAEALAFYRRALELARHDPELEETVQRMEQQVAPAAAPQLPDSEVSIEALFDFDRLVEQLGAETPPAIAALDAMHDKVAEPTVPVESAAEPAAATPLDPLAHLEAGLRSHEIRLAQTPGEADTGEPAGTEADAEALVELEHWLEALRSAPR